MPTFIVLTRQDKTDDWEVFTIMEAKTHEGAMYLELIARDDNKRYESFGREFNKHLFNMEVKSFRVAQRSDRFPVVYEPKDLTLSDVKP